MIIPEKHLLFVHIPKTGGSSIEVALTGRKLFGEHRESDRTVLDSYPEYFPLGLRHLNLRGYRKVLGSELKSYRIFTVVRNPWALAVSNFHYHCRNMEGELTPADFRRYLKSEPRILLRNFANKIGVFNKQDLCFILRFENLDQDFSGMCTELGLGAVQLPRTNVSAYRTDYRKYYDRDTRELVYEANRYDIEEFGYSFGSDKVEKIDPGVNRTSWMFRMMQQFRPRRLVRGRAARLEAG